MYQCGITALTSGTVKGWDPEQTSRKLAANGNPDLSDAPTALHPGIDQHERQERGPTTVWGP
ncbi:hypothetical protein GCM10010390_05400 [Streptomyces mordarskii]|uniref:Uncharacterized protein n=1 Tax=Streptomyces mordarskii TaxID=1226758 RepID=A0ABP3LRZ9_9ACTN